VRSLLVYAVCTQCAMAELPVSAHAHVACYSRPALLHVKEAWAVACGIWRCYLRHRE